MTLTLSLVNPAATAKPETPARIPSEAIARLAKALNTVTYGYEDSTIDGTPTACDEFWLTELAPYTLRCALVHLAESNETLARTLAAALTALLDHAEGEQKRLDIVQEGAEGAELRLSDCEEPVEPRAWTYRRMRAALDLMGLPEGPLPASAILDAAAPVHDTCVYTRTSRDAQRLAVFAQTLMTWNDEPVLICQIRR